MPEFSAKAAKLLGLWKEEFLSIYEINPAEPSEKDYETAKQIMARVESLEVVKEILFLYFRCRNEYYLQRGHSLELLFEDLNKLLARVQRKNIVNR